MFVSTSSLACKYGSVPVSSYFAEHNAFTVTIEYRERKNSLLDHGNVRTRLLDHGNEITEYVSIRMQF